MAITRTFSGFGTQDGSDYVIIGSVGTPVATEKLVIFVSISDTTKSVSSFSDDSTGGPMAYTFQGFSTATGIRVECWTVSSALPGFSFIRANMSGNSPAAMTLVEFGGGVTFGNTSSANNTTANPTLSITTQDANNYIAVGFGSVGATLATALTGTLDRTKNSTGTNPVVCSLVDNTAASAGVVTAAITLAATTWAAFGIEIRSASGGGVVRTVGPARDYTTVQAAIDASSAGDTLKLDPILFTENITLPNKGVLGSDILITSASPAINFPTAGNRITPAYAPYMPRIQSPGGGTTCVQTGVGANHYKFQWIEFPEVPLGFNAIITIGSTDDTVQRFKADEPYNITIDQCWIHGGIACGQKRGIQVDGRIISITNNWISDIKSVGQDSQSIAGQNGHGPLTITNNYMSGGTEIFIIGGGDPGVRTNMVVTGTPSTTSAAVSCSEAGHTLSELATGQGIGVLVGAVWKFTTISTITGSGSTGTLTFPALSAAPDVPGGIKAGVVLGMEGPGFGLTFQRNWCRNDPNWIEGVFTKPTGLAIPGNSTASGTLAAGAHFYTVQVFSTHGYQGATVNSAESDEVNATLAAPGTLTLTWAAKPGADFYRLWHGTSAGARTSYVDVFALTYADAGAAKTTATPGGPTRLKIKNLLEIKACQNAQIDSNIFEYCWNSSVLACGFWLKSVDQDGGGVFIQSKNIIIELNIVRHVNAFFVVNGIEVGAGGLGKPGPLTGVTIRNNLLYDSGNAWGEGGDAYAMAIGNGAVDLTVNHNTIGHKTAGGGGGLISTATDSGGQLTSFVFTNNMARKETYGMHDPLGVGDAALTAACTSHTNSTNAIADGSSGVEGASNFYKTLALWKAEFVNYTDDGVGADYTIKTASAWHNAGLDGKDIGADIPAVLTATVDVISGITGGGGGGGGSQRTREGPTRGLDRGASWSH